MRIKILLIAVVLAGMLFSLSVSAQNCKYPEKIQPNCGKVPIKKLTYTELIEIPKFDPALGELQEVRMVATSCGYGTAELDSEDETAQEFTVIAVARLIANLPVVGDQKFEIGLDETFDVEADDEPGTNNADFAGPDYSGKLEFGSAADPLCESKEWTFNTPEDLAAFIKDGGDKIPVSVGARGSITVIGSVLQESRSSAFMGFEVCVEYTYCPPKLCINGTKINDCTGKGIEGWKICLNSDPPLCIYTDKNGDYSFCGLEAGDYVVSEESREGWKHVDPEVPHIAVTLDDQSAEDVDFHNVPLFGISGHKFNYNTQEGLSGWSISLLKDGVTIATTTTGPGGYYEFLKLEPGDYAVCEEDRDGWQHMDEPCRDVTLELENVADVDFTNAPLLCISGHKFNSKTGEGISGWTIQLKDSTGAVIATTTTGTGGYYEFCGLMSGDYVVSEESRDGWKHVDPEVPHIAVTLADENAEDIDFHNVPLFSISGHKFNYNTQEGLSGWSIRLLKDGATIATTTTGPGGYYEFLKLEPGDYVVCEEDRDGWQHMDDPCRDVALDCENVADVDFNNAPLLCISGHKFNSKTGEGLSGWTIQLKDSTGAVIDTTTTGTGGYYKFCGLEAGDYEVCEVLKPGWKVVGPICIDVTLVSQDSTDNDFKNEPIIPPCVCPFLIKNDLYTASCNEVKVVDADKGILANDPAGSVVLNPESITIDPKYGTIEVNADGSFVYDPTVATGRISSGSYVIFKYNANNGYCDSKNPGIAKIQVSCPRR